MRMLIQCLVGRVVAKCGHPPTCGVGCARTGGCGGKGARVVAGLAAPVLLWSAGVGLAQTVDTTLWVADGTVNSVVRDGGTVYIGGDFSQVGPATGAGVAIDASTGVAKQPYPKVTGTIYAVA